MIELIKLLGFPAPFSVKYFDGLAQMDAYVQDDMYGSKGLPVLCLGVSIITNTNGKYEYYIRYNTTGGKPELYDTINNPMTEPFLKYYFINLSFKSIIFKKSRF